MEIAYLIRRKNRYYYARYKKADGKWSNKALGTRLAAVAKIRFKGIVKDLLTPNNIKLGKFVEKYLKHVRSNRSKSWADKQEDYINNFILPFFGNDTLLGNITKRRIEEYLVERAGTPRRRGAGTLKNTTINKELACIRALIRKAYEWEYMAENVAGRVEDLPDDSEPRIRYFTYDEYVELIQEARNQHFDQWTLPNEPFVDMPQLLMVGCNTGLRIGELLHVQFSDIDWLQRVIHVRRKPHKGFRTKSNRDRTVPLNDHAYNALQSMLAKKRDSDYVFHKNDGSPWKNINAAFRALIKRSGLDTDSPDRPCPQTMRGTFGVWCASNGIDVRVLQLLLGHSSVAVTEKFYGGVFKSRLTNAVKILDLVVPTVVPMGSNSPQQDLGEQRNPLVGDVVMAGAWVAELADARDLKSLGP